MGGGQLDDECALFSDEGHNQIENNLRVSVAKSFSVAWLDSEYVQREPCTDSQFEEVVKLINVCWLDLFYTFPEPCWTADVPPGNYDVVWRMKFDGAFAIDTVRVSTTVWGKDSSEDSGASTERVWKGGLQEMEQEAGTATWSELFITQVTLGDTSNVKVRMSSIEEGNWKSGVSWDYVELRATSQ